MKISKNFAASLVAFSLTGAMLTPSLSVAQTTAPQVPTPANPAPPNPKATNGAPAETPAATKGSSDPMPAAKSNAGVAKMAKPAAMKKPMKQKIMKHRRHHMSTSGRMPGHRTF